MTRRLFLMLLWLSTASALSAQINISFSVQEPQCYGLPGSIFTSVTGGQPPYTYLWSTGATTPFLQGVPAGAYTLTVKDLYGLTASAPVSIHQPTQVKVTLSTENDCSAPFNITATASGGMGPYAYAWSTGATSNTIWDVPSGYYCVTVTDKLMCGAVECITVDANPPSVHVTVKNVTCPGGADGVLKAVPQGGMLPYSYKWSTGATSQQLIDLFAGFYSVTITDAKGCKASATATVTQPPPFYLKLTPTSPQCGNDYTGSISVMVSGATPPYTYTWSNGATTASIMGLAPGTYGVTVADANNCKASGTATIVPVSPLVINKSIKNVSCPNGEDGAIYVTPSGGMPPYTYKWSNGSTTKDLVGLSAGTYTVTVTDSKGCKASMSATVEQPPAIVVSLSANHVSCGSGNDGTINATVSGGTPPYTYFWSNGATTEDLTNIGPGTYTLTVTDSQGCKQTKSASVTAPSALVIQKTVSNVTCPGSNNGAIQVTVSGGTPPYSYSWSNGAATEDLNGLGAGTYTLTVTDAKGCKASMSATINQPATLQAGVVVTHVKCPGAGDGTVNLTVNGGTPPYSYAWSNGAVSEDLSGLGAGTYTVTVTDANGCKTTASATITQPPAISITVKTTNVDCAGGYTGAIDITVNGGTPPYSYAWSNGAVSQDLTGLNAGVYTVTVTDANGCKATTTASIGQSSAIHASATPKPLSCPGGNDGAVNVTVSGGTPPYSYAWSNGATTEDLTGLGAGTYSLTITDAGGCKYTVSATVTQPPVIQVSAAPTQVSCPGNSDGAINLSVSGGTPPYSFAWSNGATTEDLTGLSAGTYSATVTDANGCKATATATIIQPPALIVTTTTQTIACGGALTGSITATVTGGTPPYTYAWSNGHTGPTATNLGAGSYTVTVTDAKGCKATATVALTAPPAISVSVQGSRTCVNTNAASLTAIVTGGTSPVAYAWSNGATGATINNLAPGTYTVTVTDANGCQATATATVSLYPSPTCLISIVKAPTTTSNGELSVAASGGTSPYTYQWSNGATTATISGLAAGNYSVTVTDANGCKTSCSISLAPKCVNVTDPGMIGFDQYLCGPGNDPAPLVETKAPSGGMGNLEYLWMYTTGDPNQHIDFWSPIPGTNTPSYDPGPVYETTYFIRCVRRECCDLYLESNIVTIEVGNEVTATIQGPQEVCENQTVTFTALNAAPGAVVSWHFSGSASQATFTGPTATVKWSTFGVFNVTLTVSTNGCTASSVMKVTVSNNPTTCGGALVINTDVMDEALGEVLVSWDVPATAPALTYVVERSGDGRNFLPVTTLTEPAFITGMKQHYEYLDHATKRGRNFYRVQLIDGAGVSRYSETREVMLHGEDEPVFLYPNPVVDWLTIETVEELGERGTLEIVNAGGVLVMTVTLNTTPGIQNIDLSQLPAGAYFARLRQTEGKMKTLRLLKF